MFNMPNNAYCPGGYQVLPKSGYWKYSNTSKIMKKCKLTESCLGYNNDV